MVTYTTTYNLKKPTVADDEDVWGGYLNDSMDLIDDVLDGTTPVTGIDINSGTIDNAVIGGTTAAAGTFTALSATTSLSVTGSITVSGTVDGRDVAADGTKLDNIESGATADQTASEILTAIKTVDGSGSGLDADLLDGLNSGQFLRSDASDSMSGALSISQATAATATLSVTNSGGYASNALIASFVGDSDAIEIRNNGAGDYKIVNNQQDNGISIYDGTGGVKLRYNGTDVAGCDTTGGFEVTSGDLSVTNNITVGGTVDGRDVATDGTKLDGIESNATADQTASEILTAIKTVDGSGSGLDADLWDGNQFASYLNQAVLTTSSPTFGGMTLNGTLTLGANVINDVEDIYLRDRIYHDGDTDTYIQFHAANQFRVVTGGTERFEVNNTRTQIDTLLTDAAIAEDYDALSGTTPTADPDAGGAFSLTMTGNTTFTFGAPSLGSGVSTGFIIELTGNGSTVTWPTSVDWAGGTAPDAPASGETDIYVFWTRDGGTTWYGVQSIDAAA